MVVESQLIEFILAYFTNKKIIRRKTAAFLRLCQEDAERLGNMRDADMVGAKVGVGVGVGMGMDMDMNGARKID